MEGRGGGGAEEAEEDREIAGGSGEIVARAGGQIIPVIRASPSLRFCLSLSFSFFFIFIRSLAHRAQGLGPSDDADERVYIMTRWFTSVKEKRSFLEGKREREGERERKRKIER